MPDRILVIHPSEIIRNGLKDACDGFQNIETSMLQNVDLALNTLIQKQDIRIVIIDATSVLAGNIIRGTTKILPFKTIGIYYPGDWPHRSGAFDKEINTNMPIDKIRDSMRDLLDEQTPAHSAVTKNHQLTKREQEVLKLLAMGNSHKEIGRILHISIHTVISHRKNITLKLGIKSVSGLAVYAIISGFIDTDKIDPESLI